jgi:Transposase zinc-binding domain
MACVAPVYRPRDAEHTVLHQVVALHLEAFLDPVAAASDGTGLPQFVEREFRAFLTCDVFEHGVARFRCEACGREHLLPFSCYPQQETMKSSGRRTGCSWDPARDSLQIVSGQQARQ